MHKITLPKLPHGSVLAQWMVSAGERVEAGASLALVETPDSLAQVKSPAEGSLVEFACSVGQVLEPGQVICHIGEASESPRSDSATNKETASVDTSSAASGQVIPLLMPQAGQTMEEGRVLSWMVKEGDRIAVGQIIYEIETDKATMEVEASDAGRLARIVVREGEIAEIKAPVAYLAERNEDVDAFLVSAGAASASQDAVVVEAPSVEPVSSAQAATQAVAASVDSSGRPRSSPAARKLAAAKGIDLRSAGPGSGPGGRILSTDVGKLAPSRQSQPAQGMSRMRKAIARNLAWSKQNVPHFYAKLTVEARALADAHRKAKERFKCSVNDFVLAACARAIREMPAFRSQYTDDAIVEKPAVNIGIAVGTDDGLTVPVVLNADALPLEQLAAKSRALAEGARAGKVEGSGQGVFTITNLGMFGVEEFQAIVNPPESAILAVGAVREDVVVENGAIKPTRRMTVCLSADHRVIDGVAAAKFLGRLKELLEAPESLA